MKQFHLENLLSNEKVNSLPLRTKATTVCASNREMAEEPLGIFSLPVGLTVAVMHAPLGSPPCFGLTVGGRKKLAQTMYLRPLSTTTMTWVMIARYYVPQSA